jgi:two-component system, NarL family, response regulator YdfI
MVEGQESLRILVVDDHLIVRQGLRLILEEAGDDFEIVGEAVNGEEALILADEIHPDLVLMDIRMPGMDGIEAIERLKQRQRDLIVVILTTYDDDSLILRGLRAGASGYLLKDTNRDTLFRTIRAAVRGEMLLQPEIMAHVLAAPTAASVPPESDGESDLLTEREHEVLAGVARGERSKEIAQHLHIAENTVKGYLASIYAKLGVDSRASAVMAAIDRGLLRTSE